MKSEANHKRAVSPDIRDALARRLVEVQQAKGGLPRKHVLSAATLLDVSERQVWRDMRKVQGEQPAKPRRPLTEEEQRLFFECRGNVAAVHRRLTAGGANPPSLRQLQRDFNRGLTNGARAYARNGAEGMQRYSLHLRHEPPHRNHTWEIDCWQLPVWTSAGRGAQWERPWAIVVIDGRHRAVMAWLVSLLHRKEEVLATLRRAIEVVPAEGPFGGLPDVIRWDNGLEFLANAVTETLLLLGIHGMPTAAYRPEQKGKVERLFRTLTQEWASQLPFHSDGPRARDRRLYGPKLPAMGLAVLTAEFDAFIRTYNLDRPHSALAGKTPAQSWEDDPTPLRLVSAEQLRWIEMPRAKRIVQKDGIHFEGAIFAAPELNAHVGEEVELRYFPHARETIEVFVDGSYLTTAKQQAALTDTERLEIVKQRRRDGQRASALMRTTSRRQRAWLAQTIGDGRGNDHNGEPEADPDRDELADFDLLGLARRRNDGEGNGAS